jgi:hypothetical protein
MIRRTGSFVALLVMVAGVAQAQKPESGFNSLFNGKDLSGWRYGKGQNLDGRAATPDDRFTVSGGTVVLVDRDKDGSRGPRDLVYAGTFPKGYVLKLEFKASNEAIGAVLIGNAPIPVGDYLRRGEQTHLTKFKNDGWNELEVRVVPGERRLVAHNQNRAIRAGESLEINWHYGKATVKVNDAVVEPAPTVIHYQGVRGGEYVRVNGEPLRGIHIGAPGTLALRSNFGKLEFRNIRIQELP